MDLKIGDVLYHFSENRRVYAPGGGSPIYREHFEPHTIVGETKLSWLVAPWKNAPLDRCTKVSKKDMSSARSHTFGSRGYFTAEGMEDDIWQHSHKHKICDLINRTATANQLREIAKIINYEAGE